MTKTQTVLVYSFPLTRQEKSNKYSQRRLRTNVERRGGSVRLSLTHRDEKKRDEEGKKKSKVTEDVHTVHHG